MAHRSSITASLALAGATIVLVAACGAQIAGSAEPDPAAVVSAIPTEIPSELTDLSLELSIPTELSDLSIPELSELSQLTELSDLLTALPTNLTDLGIPTDLSVPTQLSEVLSFSESCIAITFALAGVGFATLGAYLGGSDSFDAGAFAQAVQELAGAAPPESAADVQALREVAAETQGKTLSEAGAILNGEKYTTATNNITQWVDANCGG
jgi:hypothetical protein